MRIDKPVGLLLLGPSLSELDVNIFHFIGIDMYWISLNRFWIAENILKKIGKKLNEAVCLTGLEKEGGLKNQILEHGIELEKQGGLFTLEKDMRFQFPNIFDDNDPEHGIASLYFIIKWIKARGAKNVLIFGANGYAESCDKAYFKQSELDYIDSICHEALNIDQKRLDDLIAKNNPFEDMFIHNCCPESKYKSFPKITVQQSIQYLRTGVYV